MSIDHEPREVRLLLEVVVPLLVGYAVQEGVGHCAPHLLVVLYFDLAKRLDLLLDILGGTPRILGFPGLFGPFDPGLDGRSRCFVDIRHG